MTMPLRGRQHHLSKQELWDMLVRRNETTSASGREHSPGAVYHDDASTRSPEFDFMLGTAALLHRSRTASYARHTELPVPVLSVEQRD